jgi:4-hydroxy-tetrahydrodipicolinate reductase
MKVLIAGGGKMGHMLAECMERREGMDLMKMIDIDDMGFFDDGSTSSDPSGADAPGACADKPDVIIDFSHPDMTVKMLPYAIRNRIPVVLGTTGLTDELNAMVEELAGLAPVIAVSNYSYGVAMMTRMVRDFAGYFDGWDVEIIETHHNQKIDAPSGTAKTLIQAIDPDDERKKVYGREGMCGARTKGEIGVHALRGGTVAGEHTVRFYSTDETIEITHKASSRRIFAEGALIAAQKITGKAPGRYTVDDLFFG